MRRYQKWLTVGLLALTTPGMVFAGPGTTKKAPTARAQSAAAGKSAKQSANQELANRVRQSLEASDVSMYEVEIMVHNGTALLKGQVASAGDKRQAELIVRKVKGVQNVQNQLEIAAKESGSQVQQAAATGSRRQASKQVRPVAYQDAYEGAEPVQTQALPPAPPPAPGAAPGGPGSVYGGAPAYGGGAPVYGPGPGPGPGYGGPGGPAPMPAYGGPAGGPAAAGSNVIYNQPGLPNYSYPTYSQYPNYASVSYPSQYSASAWPYIGPFYPYPQVPLGWRKAQLEWDDGYWHLNFSPRTERWWWFLDWRNW